MLSNSSHPCARLSLILFLILCSAAETVALCDYFDSATLDPQWSWVREDPTHWSLTDNPGYLSIRMQHGGPYGTCNNNRNTLLQTAPTDNFEVVTCVTFNPTLNYQQAGLIVYQDTDNYVRLTRLHYEKGGGVQFFKEVGASTTAKAVGCDLTTTYLKIRKQDSTYTGYWSKDGVNWNQVYQYTDVHLSNLKVGLAAFLGSGYTEIPANFDYICIRPIEETEWWTMFEKDPLNIGHIEISKKIENSNKIIYEIIVEDYEPPKPTEAAEDFFPDSISVIYSVSSPVYICYDDTKIEYWSFEGLSMHPYSYYDPPYDALRRGIGYYDLYNPTVDEICQAEVKKSSAYLLFGLIPIIGPYYGLTEYLSEAEKCMPMYEWWGSHVYQYDVDNPYEFREDIYSHPHSYLIKGVMGKTEDEVNNRHGDAISYSSIMTSYKPKSVRFTIPLKVGNTEEKYDLRLWVSSMSPSKKIGLYFEDRDISRFE